MVAKVFTPTELILWIPLTVSWWKGIEQVLFFIFLIELGMREYTILSVMRRLAETRYEYAPSGSVVCVLFHTWPDHAGSGGTGQIHQHNVQLSPHQLLLLLLLLPCGLENCILFFLFLAFSNCLHFSLLFYICSAVKVRFLRKNCDE